MGRGAAWVAVCAAMLAGKAAAGAWTQPKGEGFASVAASYFRTDGPDRFEEVATGAYAEYGLFEAVTVAGAIEASRPVGVSSGGDGDLTLSGFLRLRLREGRAGDPLSVQVGVIGPLDGLAGGRRAAQVEDEFEIDLRGLYGRGFSTRYGDAFLDAQAGLRLRLEDSADEIKIDLTAGLRPRPRWLLLLQSFNTIGLRNEGAGGDDFDAYKIAPSIGYRVGREATLLVGVEREVAGRDIDKGLRPRIALWTRF